MQVRNAARQSKRDAKRSWLVGQAVEKALLGIVGGALLVLAPLGCAVTAPDTNVHTTSKMTVNLNGAAEKSLDRILRAYEAGEALDSFISETMIDVQTLQSSIRDTQNQQKQIRVLLKDGHLSLDEGMIVIHANWEKRYLSLPNLSPQLVSGRASFSMSHTANGWRLSRITGDNVFAAAAK